MAYHPFRHIGLKVVALVCASLLWLTVAGEHIAERNLRVPLEFRNKPPLLEVVGDPPDSVEARLSGSSALLSRLDPGQVVAGVDLQQARPGSRLFHIRPEEVRTPYGIDVVQVIPGTLALELERTLRRVVPVIAATDGEPAPGFVLGPIIAEPATVEIEGPESRVKKLANATTEPITVNGAREHVRDVVAVGLIDAAVRLIKPQDVTVIVEVLPAPIERELGGVLVRARNLGNGLAAPGISPGSVALSVRGRREALSGVDANSVDAFVDLAGLGPGQYNLRVQVDPSQHFGVSDINPAVVSVTLRAIK